MLLYSIALFHQQKKFKVRKLTSESKKKACQKKTRCHIFKTFLWSFGWVTAVRSFWCAFYTPFNTQPTVRWELRARRADELPPFHHLAPLSVRGFQAEAGSQGDNRHITDHTVKKLPPHCHIRSERSLARAPLQQVGIADVILIVPCTSTMAMDKQKLLFASS